MKKIILIIAVLIPHFLLSQTEVEVKGYGSTRQEAVQDGLRAAVGKAVGVKVKSLTKVEDFEVVKDAISTKTEGYVTHYDVIKSTPMSDHYEVTIKATVSLEAVEQDAKMLADMVGGLSFLVMFDKRDLDEEKQKYYNFAYKRINEALADRKYRYIQQNQYDKHHRGSISDLGSEIDRGTLMESIGIRTEAEFVIDISEITLNIVEKDMGVEVSAKVHAETYDNCTSEGLGPAILVGEPKTLMDKDRAVQAAITDAVSKGMDRLLFLFNQYMGDWTNNGSPYQIQFLNCGKLSEFAGMRSKMKKSPDYGGQFKIRKAKTNYISVNVKYTTTPDELIFKIMEMVEEDTKYKEKELGDPEIYGRRFIFKNTKEQTPPNPPKNDETNNEDENKKVHN